MELRDKIDQLKKLFLKWQEIEDEIAAILSEEKPKVGRPLKLEEEEEPLPEPQLPQPLSQYEYNEVRQARLSGKRAKQISEEFDYSPVEVNIAFATSSYQAYLNKRDE